MRLLDLYCKAGGCSMGYYKAGFTDIVGIDIEKQLHYPFRFMQADALDFLAEHWQEFDLIHASPPCQVHSVTASLSNGKHLDLIPQTRSALITTGKPYVIENVPGASLINPLMLCGTMFGLGVIRHRLFECNPPIWFPPSTCKHDGTSEPIFGNDKKRDQTAGKIHKFVTVAGHGFIVKKAAIAMNIDWMNQEELAQAIPPAYTEYIGKIFMEFLEKTPK